MAEIFLGSGITHTRWLAVTDEHMPTCCVWTLGTRHRRTGEGPASWRS